LEVGWMSAPEYVAMLEAVSMRKMFSWGMDAML
jgi:hypothetical protein